MGVWTKITLGLIAFAGLLVLVIVATADVSVVVQAPDGEAPPPMAWALAWLFILMSAVIIVAVTAVRLVSKAVRRLRGKPPAPASGPWS